jgi:LysR family nitrogen assimilation transcriptional regulator
MNLRQLSYFLKIAELRSFTHAANALYVSQPALSKQMRQLEEELGTALFIRSDRGIKLTEAGELLRARSPAVLDEIARLRNDLQNSYNQDPSGSLAVGIGISVRDLVTVPVVSRYLQRYPNVALHVREGITGPLVDDIKLGTLDCALLFEVDPLEQVIAEPYVRETLLLAGPAGCGLALDKPVELAEALRLPLATTGGNSPLRTRIEQSAAALGIALHIVFEANAVALMLGCLASGTHYTILPYSALHAALAEGAVRAAPIAGFTIDWSFVYARNFGLPLAGRALRRFLFERAEELHAGGLWKFCEPLYARDTGESDA